MQFDVADLDADSSYRLLSGAVIPRPIAWVTSLGDNGQVNAAPFSFYNAISSLPPTVGVAVSDSDDGGDKHSLANARRRRAFVVHTVDEATVEAAVVTSLDFPDDIGEAEALGLATTPSLHVPVPRLVDAAVAMECRLLQTVVVGDATLMIGEVLCFHVRDDLVRGDRIDGERFAAVGRMAGAQYTRTHDRFELRPGSYQGWRERKRS